jgi:protein-tyrosine phosphatase
VSSVRAEDGLEIVLMLCTGNMCRSPAAAALLARRLAALGERVAVRSAGLAQPGCAPPPEMVLVMAGYGIDLRPHRSRVVGRDELVGADLVLGMTREHVRHAVVTAPGAWPRAFTLAELVRRGERAGSRPVGEPLPSWLARARDGRQRAHLLGSSPDDDVADPMGGPPQAYAATAVVLDRLVSRLAELCWGRAAAPRPGAPPADALLPGHVL